MRSRPNLWRAVSDFDTTHQFNANWVWDLALWQGPPLGQQRELASSMRIFGGWGLNGLWRWTSGFPFQLWEPELAGRLTSNWKARPS